MRVCLDTNVVVSAFATRGLCADLFQVILADHQPVVGETVLAELRRVLNRKLRVSRSTVDEIETFLRQHADIVSDAPAIPLEVRDTADRLVADEAVAGRADVLVTGDGDLLGAAAGAPLPIVSPRAFWELLRAGSGHA